MKQAYEKKSAKIREAFYTKLHNHPEQFKNRLKFSWSNWGFGFERLDRAFSRLNDAGIEYIELHGNHYGKDLGYSVKDVEELKNRFGMEVSGVCGMFSSANDLSSNDPRKRQEALDYIKREVEFTEQVGGEYLLVVPGAVGRPDKYDDMERDRSAETLRQVADLFGQSGIKAAIEPVRAAEVSFVHTVREALGYIDEVGHPGVSHINGDTYHMLAGEDHTGEAIMEAGDKLVNLHMADSNRGALGTGQMDIDTIIMALYLTDYNNRPAFVTPEPLGPGGDPYPAMHAKADPAQLKELVEKSHSYFREREAALLEGSAD